MTLEPLEDKLVVTVDVAKDVTEAGLVVPEMAREKPTTGTVTARGPDCKAIQVGDRVAFPKYAGSEFQLGSDSYLLIRECELIGRLKD